MLHLSQGMALALELELALGLALELGQEPSIPSLLSCRHRD
jgi:hypothetical protein